MESEAWAFCLDYSGNANRRAATEELAKDSFDVQLNYRTCMWRAVNGLKRNALLLVSTICCLFEIRISLNNNTEVLLAV